MPYLKKKSGRVSEILKKHKIARARVLEALRAVRGRRSVNTDNPEGTYDVLKKYGRDLVSEARARREEVCFAMR